MYSIIVNTGTYAASDIKMILRKRALPKQRKYRQQNQTSMHEEMYTIATAMSFKQYKKIVWTFEHFKANKRKRNN